MVKKLQKMNKTLINEIRKFHVVKVVNGIFNKMFFLNLIIVLCDYIDFAVFIDDIDNLIDAIEMVGEAYLDFANLANAFFAFRQMVHPPSFPLFTLT